MFIIFYLHNISIYITNLGQSYIKAMWWVLNVLKKHGRLSANLKKGWFYKNKMHFFRYVILAKEVRIKDKRIEMVKN